MLFVLEMDEVAVAYLSHTATEWQSWEPHPGPCIVSQKLHAVSVCPEAAKGHYLAGQGYSEGTIYQSAVFSEAVAYAHHGWHLEAHKSVL